MRHFAGSISVRPHAELTERDQHEFEFQVFRSSDAPLWPFFFIVVGVDIGFGMKLAGAEFFLGFFFVFVFLGAGE
jgi:hypothetical protein